MEVLLNSRELVVGSFHFGFGRNCVMIRNSAVISYMNSINGYWWKSTYDSNGKELSYVESTTKSITY